MDPVEILFSDNHSEQVASDAFDFVWTSFSDALIRKEQEAKAIPFSAALAIAKLHQIVKLATYQYDGKDVSAEQPFEVMTAEDEPQANVIDSWARGTVSTRQVVTDPNTFRRMPAKSSTPSVSSYRSSGTGRSRGTSGNRSYRSTLSKSAIEEKSGQIIDLDVDGEFSADKLKATGYLFDMLQTANKKKSQGFFAAKEGVKGEFDILEEQLTKAQKDMKGTKFILDRYGNPVAVGKVDAQRLPSQTSTLHTSVHAESTSAADKHSHKHSSGRAAGASVGPASSSNGKKQAFVRVAGSRAVDQSSFQPTLSLATTLSGVQAIPQVTAGVTVRSKLAERAGDAVEEDPQHISMKTYLTRQQQAQQQAQRGGLRGNSQSPAFAGAQSRSLASSSMQQSGLLSASSQQGMTRSMESIPDVDALEGSRRVAFASPPRDLTDRELGLGPTGSEGLNSNSHTPSSMQLPRKPSQQQKQNVELLRGSPDKGKPKDRDLPINARAVADRKHLAAPALGQVTGHGVLSDVRSPHSPSHDSISATESWVSRQRK